MYYEFKVKREAATPKGVKEVTECRLTDCVLFAEAEHAGLAVCGGKGDVVAIYRSDIYEIVNPGRTEGEYYKATIASQCATDKGGVKERKYRVLVNAVGLEEATRIVRDYMRQGLEDMRLDKVEKSRIVEIV